MSYRIRLKRHDEPLELLSLRMTIETDKGPWKLRHILTFNTIGDAEVYAQNHELWNYEIEDLDAVRNQTVD